MSISSMIFESVSIKSKKELMESQKSEEFIADLKTALRSVADGNVIDGYPTPEGAILNFTVDHRDGSEIAEHIDTIIAEEFPEYIANTNIDADDILDNVMVEVSRKEDIPDDEESEGLEETVEITVDEDGVKVASDEEVEVVETEPEECEDGECKDTEEVKEPSEDPEESTDAVEFEEPAEATEESSEKVNEAVKMTSKELKDKFGTDDVEIINAGKPEDERVEKVEDVDKEIADFIESAYEDEETDNEATSEDTEELTEKEVPASNADFAHSQFKSVTETIRVISELKAQDTENSLYTDLLKAYDDVQKILKDYIGEQPVTIETPAETPAEEPVETSIEEPAEDVSIEATEVEGE